MYRLLVTDNQVAIKYCLLHSLDTRSYSKGPDRKTPRRDRWAPQHDSWPPHNMWFPRLQTLLVLYHYGWCNRVTASVHQQFLVTGTHIPRPNVGFVRVRIDFPPRYKRPVSRWLRSPIQNNRRKYLRTEDAHTTQRLVAKRYHDVIWQDANCWLLERHRRSACISVVVPHILAQLVTPWRPKNSILHIYSPHKYVYFLFFKFLYLNLQGCHFATILRLYLKGI